jgi:hypothetical protein
MRCAYIPSHENTDSEGKPRSEYDGRYPGPKLKWPDGRIIRAFQCCSKCLSWRKKDYQLKRIDLAERTWRRLGRVEDGQHYCSRCKGIKPLAEFNVRSIGGPAGWCKVCANAYQKERAARASSAKPAFVERQDKGALRSWRTNPDGSMLIAFERGVVEVSLEGEMAWIPRSA